MSEIININIGKAGVRIGQEFIKKIANEHFQTQSQKRGKFDVFFNQNEVGYEPRSFFFDIDPKPIQRLKLKQQKYTINQKNLFKGSGILTDLYVTGHYQQGIQIVAQQFQNIRKQVEKCDVLSGFVLINSLGGGTGSGMTASILQKLRQYYCSSIVQPYCILPETQIFYNPIQIYNTVLALSNFIEVTDLTIFSQNEAFNQRMLYEGKLRPSMKDINQMNAQNLCEITAPLRFGGFLNTSQRKTCVNMVMFPRMKFLISSFSSPQSKFDHLQNALNYRNYSKTNFFEKVDGHWDIYTIQVNCRDNFMYESEIDKKVKDWAGKNKLIFTDWIINRVHQTITQPVSLDVKSSVLINSKYIANTFRLWSQQFTTAYRRKAFIHYYLAGGMDQMQFTEAQSNLNDLVSQYTPYSNYFDEDDQFMDDQDGQARVQ